MNQANTIKEFVKASFDFLCVANTNALKAKVSRRDNTGELKFAFVCQPVMKNNERGLYIEARKVRKDGSAIVRNVVLNHKQDGIFFDLILEQFQAFSCCLYEHKGIVQQYKFLDKQGNVKDTKERPLQLNENLHFVSDGLNYLAIAKMFEKMF
jgi:hypothetical protein